jgi:hypothetical protein
LQDPECDLDAAFSWNGPPLAVRGCGSSQHWVLFHHAGEMNMKRTWIVLVLLVATGAAGCGTENPTGPSFARSTPPVETAAATVSISPEPGIDNSSWTAEPEPDVVDVRNGDKVRKPKKPKHNNGH